MLRTKSIALIQDISIEIRFNANALLNRYICMAIRMRINVVFERLGILIKQVTRFCQGVSVFESFVKSPVFSQMVGAIF